MTTRKLQQKRTSFHGGKKSKSRSLPRIARAPKRITSGDVQPKKAADVPRRRAPGTPGGESLLPPTTLADAAGIVDAARAAGWKPVPLEESKLKLRGTYSEMCRFVDQIRAERAAANPVTFTLSQFANAFGGNYGPILVTGTEPTDQLSLAMSAIDDLRCTIFLVNEVVGNESGVGDVLSASWHRASAALEVLGKFRAADRVQS